MPSRFGATIEHVWKDKAHHEKGDPLGWAATGAAKVHDAVSGLWPSVIGAFNTKEFQVVPRDGITASTRAALHNTLEAQWIRSGPGRILNVVPMAITAVLELPDGLIRDGLHFVGGGGANEGYVVKSAEDVSKSMAA